MWHGRHLMVIPCWSGIQPSWLSFPFYRQSRLRSAEGSPAGLADRRVSTRSRCEELGPADDPQGLPGAIAQLKPRLALRIVGAGDARTPCRRAPSAANRRPADPCAL